VLKIGLSLLTDRRKGRLADLSSWASSLDVGDQDGVVELYRARIEASQFGKKTWWSSDRAGFDCRRPRTGLVRVFEHCARILCNTSTGCAVRPNTLI
jgi:hypothetical protein